MRRRSVCVVAVLVLALAGCREHLGPHLPPGPGPDITGFWGTFVADFSTTLDLTQTGSTVTGTGGFFRNIVNGTGSITVTGTNTTAGISLRLVYSNGQASQFTAVLRNDQIVGREVYDGGGTDSLTLARQAPPP